MQGNFIKFCDLQNIFITFVKSYILSLPFTNLQNICILKSILALFSCKLYWSQRTVLYIAIHKYVTSLV